jgi:hypothetical protein
MNVLPVASGLARPFRDLQETEGLFRKMTKDSVARHVPLGALWCEQRAVGFKNSDSFETEALPRSHILAETCWSGAPFLFDSSCHAIFFNDFWMNYFDPRK